MSATCAVVADSPERNTPRLGGSMLVLVSAAPDTALPPAPIGQAWHLQRITIEPWAVIAVYQARAQMP